MSDAKHFRFMDLPTELRLMVYEELSIVTTHYAYHVKEKVFVHPINAKPHDIQLISKTLPGVTLLAVIHQINSEVGTIKHKLMSIKNEPIQVIVTNPRVDQDMLDAMVCACQYSFVRYGKRDVRKSFWFEDFSTISFGWGDDAKASRHVHVAVFFNADHPWKITSGRFLDFGFYLIQLRMKLEQQATNWRKKKLVTHIQFRLALPSPEYTAAKAAMVSSTTLPTLRDSASTLQLGDSIEPEEWAENWMEG